MYKGKFISLLGKNIKFIIVVKTIPWKRREGDVNLQKKIKVLKRGGDEYQVVVIFIHP